jgi:excisionase family DNA binding protein
LQTYAELRFLTVEETSSLLRVEVGTIRNWVSQNRIPYRKAGSSILFLLEEILTWTLPPARQKATGLKAVE